jgi:transcriptional regulator with XRE-family HTH domain
MSNIEKRSGSKITEIRLSKKLTQAQLAEKLNVSVETISRMERGVSFPSLKTLENLSHALNVHLKSLFDFDEEKSKDQAFERELSKLIVFLRTLRKKDIANVHDILKFVFKRLR